MCLRLKAYRAISVFILPAICLAFLLAVPEANAQRFVKVVNTIDELVRLNPNDVHTNVFVADPSRGGLFTLAPRGTTNSGTAFASTNATKQWNRQYGDSINVKWFGADSSGTTSSGSAVSNAVVAANASNNGLLFPPGNYSFPWKYTLSFDAIPSVSAQGASLTNLKVNLSSGIKWSGGYFTQVVTPGTTNATAVITVSGDNCVVDGVRIYYPPAGDINVEAYTGIQFTGGDYGDIRNGEIDMGSRSCMTILGGSQGRIQNWRIKGGDDGIVFKNTVAANATEDWTVTGIVSEFNANIVSIGTEITNAVRNIAISGLVGTNVTTAVWIKPGHTSYGTDALVENISIDNIRIVDTTGSRYQRAVYLTGLQTADIRGVRISDVGVIARAASTGIVRAFVHLYANNTYINDVTVNHCWFRDAELGAVGKANPVLFGVYLETANSGTITNITFSDITIDGTSQHAYIEEGANITQIKLTDWRTRHNNVAGGTNVIYAVTAPELHNIEIESALTYPIWPDPGVYLADGSIKRFRGPFLSLDIPGQINNLITKSTVAAGDNFLIEDSAASFSKKVVTHQAIVNSATNLIHTDVSDEIHNFITKGTPVGDDVVLIEDSAAGWAKRVITVNSLRRSGTAVLAGGTATVSTTFVTASSRIFLTANIPGGTPGALYVSARNAGVDFTITSTSGADTSTVAWMLFEP